MPNFDPSQQSPGIPPQDQPAATVCQKGGTHFPASLAAGNADAVQPPPAALPAVPANVRRLTALMPLLIGAAIFLVGAVVGALLTGWLHQAEVAVLPEPEAKENERIVLPPKPMPKEKEAKIVIDAPPPPEPANPNKQPAEWIVIFRSSDPSLWDSVANDAENRFARPVSSVPDDIEYLRLQAAPDKYIIIAVTKDQLAEGNGGDRYRWHGRNDLKFNARQLGVFDSGHPKSEKGSVTVALTDFYPVWGFGTRTHLSDKQGYGWGGKEIEPTVIEVAVKQGPLTQKEQEYLLK